MCLVVSSAACVELVTRPEVEVSRAHALPALARSRSIESPLAPRIDLIAPDVAGAVRSPLMIVVRFAATAPAKIDPESFRAYYGALRINITDRIKKNAQVLESGISVEGATLPSGSHRLVLVIADSTGRVAEKDIRFTVE